ncbi:hypothetical protein GWK47_005760 [Chionoecetes opilio]|uniref:Uncharacterized protein n=1 Tax=Chionoecetes opilio TaxID=41210 RepID=A0A8J5CYM4_CHIOP|nr:hypothetical protein GWK47_005760 [Chionoecetes opilio]
MGNWLAGYVSGNASSGAESLMSRGLRQEGEGQERTAQAQNIVHDRLALRQPHLDEQQGVSLSHPHLISSKTASGARLTVSGTVVGTRDLLVSSFSHPYFSTSSSGGSASFTARIWMLDDAHVSRFLRRPRWSVVESIILVLMYTLCLFLLPKH